MNKQIPIPTPQQFHASKASAVVPPVIMSEETEKLFRRWLQLQIASLYWNMVSRVIIILLVGASLIGSVALLGPIVQNQMGVLSGMMNTLNTLNTMNPGSNKPVPTNTDSDSFDVFGIIKQLSPDQKGEGN